MENSVKRRQELEEEDDDELDEGWKITKEMMDVMDKSTWLKQELQDGGLRQIIAQIDAESNRVTNSGKTSQEEALEKAKSKYKPFEGFVDKLLVITGILEREETEEKEEMEDWLERDSDDLGPLALKPVPRKIPMKLPAVLDDSDESVVDSSSEDSDDGSSDSDSSEDDDSDDE